MPPTPPVVRPTIDAASVRAAGAAILLLAAILLSILFGRILPASDPVILSSMTVPAQILAVVPGSPSWVAGVRAGDRVVTIEVMADGRWVHAAVDTANGIVHVVPDRVPTPVEILSGSVGIAVIALLVFGIRRSEIGWWMVFCVLLILAKPLMYLVPEPLSYLAWTSPLVVGVLYAVDPARSAHPRATAAAGVAVIALLAWLWVFKQTDVPIHVIHDFTPVAAIAGLAFLVLGATTWAWRRGLVSTLRYAGPVAAFSVAASEAAGMSAVARSAAREDEDRDRDLAASSSALAAMEDAIASATSPSHRHSAAVVALTEHVVRMRAAQQVAVLETGGLLPAIEWLAERVEATSGITVEIVVEGDPVVGPSRRPDIERSVFAVVSEAMANVVQHAGAQHVVIRYGKTPVESTITVADDGSGMPGGAAARRRGGIRTMRNMARLIGGSVTVTSVVGRSTTVRLRWRT